MRCFFCAYDTGPTVVLEPSSSRRLAFDPWLGRLWSVCPSCHRWSAVPMEERWEVVEACERFAQAKRQVMLTTEHLCLLKTPVGQLIRVGQAPRSDVARWRYSDLLDSFQKRGGLLALLTRLPVRPVGGNIAEGYIGGVPTVPSAWIGSPFIAAGDMLTMLFASVPLAPSCPGCQNPLLILPHEFSSVRLTVDAGNAAIVAHCALCGSEAAVSVPAARPAVRTGLAIVSRSCRDALKVSRAATLVDRSYGPEEYICNLARRDQTLGMLSPKQRLALWISLDETSEAEMLEAEWRRAEELASIIDRDLTEVPGLAEFRARVLDSTHDAWRG